MIRQVNMWWLEAMNAPALLSTPETTEWSRVTSMFLETQLSLFPGVHRQLKNWAAPMLNGRARRCQLDFVGRCWHAASAVAQQLLMQVRPSCKCIRSTLLAMQSHLDHAKLCRRKWVTAYEPSEWEEEWRANAEEYQVGTCKRMNKQKDLVDAWMGPMNASFSRNAIPSELPAFQDTKVGIDGSALLPTSIIGQQCHQQSRPTRCACIPGLLPVRQQKGHEFLRAGVLALHSS